MQKSLSIQFMVTGLALFSMDSANAIVISRMRPAAQQVVPAMIEQETSSVQETAANSHATVAIQVAALPTQQASSVDQEDALVARLPQVQVLTALQLKDMLAANGGVADGEQTDLVIVNVLGKNLHDDCHIAGSINVPLTQWGFCAVAKEWEAKGWHTSKTFVVYCALHECDASEKAYYMLKGMGFNNVFAYEGGIREWHLLGYPTTGPCSFDYLKPDFILESRSCICDGLCKTFAL